MMPVALASSSGVFSQREQSTGTIVTATKSDMTSENITTTDSCVNMMLAVPERNSSGRNTAIWVSRSEERRVGKECRSRRSPHHQQKNRTNTCETHKHRA